MAPKPQSGFVGVIVVLALLSLVAAALFNQPIERLHIDPSRWMYEASRAAAGDVPYRDFTWQYFPAAIYIAGCWGKFFGISIFSFGAFVCCASSVIVLLAWFVLVQGELSILRAGLLVTVASALSSLTAHERIFSLNMATPASLTALVGGFSCIAGFLIYARSHRPLGLWVAACGASLAVLSKFDFGFGMLGVITSSLLLGRLDRNRWSYQLWLVHFVGPTFCIITASFLLVGLSSGFQPLLLGMGGFGIAQSSLRAAFKLDLFQIAFVIFHIALGVMCAVHLIYPAALRKIHSFLFNEPGYSIVAWGVAAGLLILAIRGIFPSVVFGHLTRTLIADSVWAALAFAVSAPILLWKRRLEYISPLIWTVTLVSAMLAFSYMRVLIAGAGSPVAPIFLGTYFLGLIAFSTKPPTEPVKEWRRAFLACGVFAIAVGTVAHFSFQPSYVVHSAQGEAKTFEAVGDPLQQTLNWINANTTSQTPMVSAPYGAGINYLADRKSPLRQTQYWAMRLPPKDQAHDTLQLANSADAIVVSLDEKNLGEAGARLSNPLLWKLIDERFSIVARFRGPFHGANPKSVRDVTDGYVVRLRKPHS